MVRPDVSAPDSVSPPAVAAFAAPAAAASAFLAVSEGCPASLPAAGPDPSFESPASSPFAPGTPGCRRPPSGHNPGLMGYLRLACPLCVLGIEAVRSLLVAHLDAPDIPLLDGCAPVHHARPGLGVDRTVLASYPQSVALRRKPAVRSRSSHTIVRRLGTAGKATTDPGGAPPRPSRLETGSVLGRPPSFQLLRFGFGHPADLEGREVLDLRGKRLDVQDRGPVDQVQMRDGEP